MTHTKHTTLERGVIPDPAEVAWISVREAALILGIADSTAYKAAKNGQLPIVRLGSRMMVPVARLREQFGLNVAA